MKEHPILFSTPMVQAILDGRKTMTRRIIKPQAPEECKFIGSTYHSEKNRTGFYWSDNTEGDMQGFWPGTFEDIFCKFGQSGDILWVRETWCLPTLFDGFEKDYYFKAGFNPTIIDNKNASQSWKPSIHMPKIAARIWLQVEEIRVERLQDISWGDAIAEGIHVKYWGGDTTQPYAYRKSIPEGLATDYRRSPIEAFQDLWQSINGNDWNIGWNANPWVWVVKFKVLSTTGKPSF